MDLPIIPIGNSKGIRLPKTLLDRYHITDRVELILEEEQLVLRPITAPRQGWDTAFATMHHNGDDQLLMDDVWPDDTDDLWS